MENICRNIQKQMPEFIMGLLPTEKAAELERHISQCSSCREYLEVLQGDDKLLSRFAEALQPSITRVENNVIDALNRGRTEKPVRSISILRMVMRSRIAKFAAAAVIIIAVLISIEQFGGSLDGASIAFADVVRPLMVAETGRFELIIDVAAAGLDWIDYKDQPLQTIEVVFAGPTRTRWNIPSGEVLVANMIEGKVMILIPAKKEATVIQIHPPGTIPRHNRFDKLLSLRPLIQYALQNEDKFVKYLGERKIDGVTAVGYHITGPAHHGEIIVWADIRTKQSILIEQSMQPLGREEKVILSDIKYGLELEQSLFSVEPPEDYYVNIPGAVQPTLVIKGIVTDAATGKPIEQAKVSDGGYGPKPYKGAVTDSDGNYRYLTWPEEHDIVAEASGFKSQRKPLPSGLFHTLEDANEVVINFELVAE